MKENLSIKLNLTKIQGASLVNLKGNTITKKCIIIPVDDAGLYVGEKGVYLDLQAIAYKDPKYADTHFIKPTIEKEKYNAMTKEEQDAIPIIGGVKILERKVNEMESAGTMEAEHGSDLPF